MTRVIATIVVSAIYGLICFVITSALGLELPYAAFVGVVGIIACSMGQLT